MNAPSAPRWSQSPVLAALILAGSVVGGIALVSGASSAPSGTSFAAPAPNSVAVVDLARLMNGLDELRARNAQYEQSRKALQDEINRLGERIAQVETELRDVIPATDTRTRSQRMGDRLILMAERESKARVYQQLIDLENGDVIRELYGKVIASIDAFAKREGYDLVMLDDRSIQLPERAPLNEFNARIESKRILYARDGMDITDRLMTLMNAEFRAGGQSR